MAEPKDYLLQSEPELEQLRLQARVWEPEAEQLLKEIGVSSGWHCLDLGCGGMGILRPLARSAGPDGVVTGVELDPLQLKAARSLVAEEALENVSVLEGDAWHTGLPPGSFDLVHVRFLFAPCGGDEALLQEMISLTRPGGIVAIQEPDTASWNCWPPNQSWNVLKKAIQKAFASGGGDLDAGTRMYGLLQTTEELQQVQLRSAVISLPGTHPYAALPLQFAVSLRDRILTSGILSPAELDLAIRKCREALTVPDLYVTSFTVNQVWAVKATT